MTTFENINSYLKFIFILLKLAICELKNIYKINILKKFIFLIYNGGYIFVHLNNSHKIFTIFIIIWEKIFQIDLNI